MIRAKTKRRLVILLLSSVAVIGLGGGAYAARKYMQRQAAFAARDAGLAAAKAGDYAAALEQLHIYIRKYPNDADVLYQYALARQNVPEPDGGHLSEAIDIWRQYLDLKPGDLAARRRYLDLCVNGARNTEAVDTANLILTQVPNDAPALRARAIAMFRLRKFEDARKDMDTLRRLEPDNFENFQLSYVMQAANGATAEQLVAYAADLQKSHPDDPQFALLLSVAQDNAGNRAAAANVLRRVAARPVSSPAVLQLLINQLDKLDLNAEALAAVRAAAAAHLGEVAYQRLLAERLFTGADYAALDALAGDQSAPRIADDPQILVLHGLSLALRGKLADASLIFQAVKSRAQADALAGAMASAAGAVWSDSLEPKARVEACRQALRADVVSPFLHFLLAEASSQQGDVERALREWQTAFAYAPAWGLPQTRCARTFLGTGRPGDALRAARLAYQRVPNDKDTLITMAMASSAALAPNQADDAARLLTLLNDIRARFPEAQEVRPLLVSVLARAGRRDDALAEFRAILNLTPPPLESTFLQLAAISHAQNLGLDDACFERSEKAHGMTPPLALARALNLSRANHPAEALALFESAMPPRDAGAVWRLAYARLLGLVDDPRAKAAWIALADAFPKDTEIQWSACGAPSVQDDHEFLGRTIQRLREQLGQDNIDGRLAQAIWLLQGRPSAKQYSEASVLLGDITRAAPDKIEARTLLADCLQRLGNISGAVEQMRAVARVRPEDHAVALRLATLLRQQGETDAARAQLDVVAQEPNSPAIRQQAAAMFLALGDRDRARTILEQHPDASSAVLLAQIYMLRREPPKAEDICRKFLDKPSAGLIEFYANFLASQGRTTDARTLLAKLDAAAAPPGMREVIRAEFLARYGKPDEALVQYAAATRAAPKEPATWRALLRYNLRSGRLDDVKTQVIQALAAIPADPGFAALRDRLPLAQDLAATPGAGSLLPALLQNPGDIEPLEEAIRLAADSRKTAPAAQTIAQIRQLAERYPRVLPIQLFAAEFLISKSQFDSAAALASRAMAVFPESDDLARLCAGAQGGAGHWAEAIAAATQWRQRNPGQAMQADVVIAATYRNQGKPADGIRQLDPYLDRALKAPDDYSGLLVVYAQNLFAANQVARAQEILAPLLTSARWRSAWLTLADYIADPASRAAWIQRVAPLVPADAVSEKIVLARCYQGLAEMTHDESWNRQIRTLVDPLVNRTDLRAGDLVALGMLLEAQKDTPAAEQLYRRALKADPQQAIALNNLAMILLNADRNPQETLDFARRAVQASALPVFYDTQATVMARQKDYDNALKSIDAALSQEPDNIEWQATRLVILAQANRRDQANSEFLRFKTAGALDKLSASARARLAALGLK
jgi:Tfp pilus assembly protein PilF